MIYFKKNKLIILTGLFIVLLISFIFLKPVLAGDASPDPEAETTPAGISSGVKSFGTMIYGPGEPPSPQQVAVLVINTLLTLLGILFVGLIIYGGYIYLTSQGADDKIKKAKAIISTAVIGLLIVVTAYAIANFVITALLEAYGDGGGGLGEVTGDS